MTDPAASFALFVSCVEGVPVTRFGTRTFIGAERRALEPKVIDYQPEHVVAIPHGEFGKFRREYTRALSNGSLTQRTAADWLAQNRQGSEKKQGAGTPRAPKNAQE